MMQSRGPAIVLAIGGLLYVSSPAPASNVEVTRLDSGTSIERSVTGRTEERFAVALRAHEYARIAVEQRGVDLVVATYDAAGHPLAEFEDEIRTCGEEQAEVVADADGVYSVGVRVMPGDVRAGSYTIRLISRRSVTASDQALQDARHLQLMASHQLVDGRFADARAGLEQALDVVERVLGADSTEAASVAADLAEAYRRLPDDARSKELFAHAVSVLDRALGPSHPRSAVARARQAVLFQNMGERAKAEALLRDALATIETSLGTENRWYLSALSSLATLYNDGGDTDQEEATLRQAMAGAERIGDVHSLNYAGMLTNLGEVYRLRRDFPRAEALYTRSLAVGAAIVGEDGYLLATPLQDLGIVARERKDYTSALGYYQRALSIRERVVGSEHPDVAQLLVNIANIYRAKGDTTDALTTQFRALSIWEHSAGPYREATLITVGNIARTYAAAGSIDSAIAYQRRADAIIEKELELNLAIGSERQKLLFVDGMSERTDRTISLHLLQASDNADAAALAALVLLQRKGRVQDAMIDTFAAGRRLVVDPRDVALLDELKTTTAELARVALTADVRTQTAQSPAIASLEARKERLEAELSEHSAGLRAQMQPVTVEAVQAAIPDEAALLEFVVFRPFDPRAERNADAYGAPHYAAYVLRPGAAPHGLDLGPAAAIDHAVDVLRDALRDPARADVVSHARALDELVMRPLRASLDGATRLLISPDGGLNLVPFEAMVDEHDRYLVERFATSYVTSGRDLLRMRVPRENRSGPAIFADPLFGEPAHRRSITTGADLASMYFAPLPATVGEARAIKALFPDATVFAGARATKASLQRVDAPFMLHIAAHGFFLADARSRPDNPLLRSGLAFAGANLPNAKNGAILTALEASSLNLWGTKLVTLSACDTGIGDVRNGEGVYGLRRAFVLAGTETLVMTLWPVTDAIARETMISYYTELRAGLGRGDALRQSKLALRAKPGHQHPYYWAGFIQSGDWTNLDGQG